MLYRKNLHVRVTAVMFSERDSLLSITTGAIRDGVQRKGFETIPLYIISQDHPESNVLSSALSSSAQPTCLGQRTMAEA